MPPTIEQYRTRLANITVGPTTLRRQGASGVNEAARRFLRGLDLTPFVQQTEDAFLAELDRQTEQLRTSLPTGAQHFGSARKVLNLYLAEAYYHRFLCAAYGVDTIAPFLEAPLDSQVANYLYAKAKETGHPLQPWPGLKYLTSDQSRAYQRFATDYAARKGVGWFGVHIDVIAWRR